MKKLMINTIFTITSFGFSALASAENNVVSQLQYDADGTSVKSLFIRAADHDWDAATDCGSPAFLFVNSDDEEYETIEKLAILALTTGKEVNVGSDACAEASNGGTYGKISYFTIN